MSVTPRTPQQARAALTRILLLAIPASVVAFVPLDFFSHATQTPGLIASRIIFIGAFGLAAWRLPKLGERATRFTFIALSIASSLALALMCQGTGGVSSPAFTFTWALPLMIGLLFVNEPACPLAGGLTSLPLGAWLLHSAGKPFVELMYWLMVTVVTTAVATTASTLSRRLHRLELQHEKDSERRLANILDSLPLGVIVSTANRLLYSNRLSRELLTTQIEANTLQLLKSGTGEPYSSTESPHGRALAGHPTTLDDAELLLPGKRIPVEVHGVPVKTDGGTVDYVVTVFRDITERRQLQARLAHADRLTSLGTLAAGVAHEINNPLASVLANLELSQDQLKGPLDAPALIEVRSQIADAALAANRIGSIVADMGSFSRAEASNSLVADLQRVVEAALQMAKAALSSKAVTVTTDFAGAGLVSGNEGKLAQVFWNLLMNATQAMPQGRPGNAIAIKVFSDQGKVVAEVTDNGAGISLENLPRVFEPFFTTRDFGQGTGLGLSICHGILKAIGGEISAQSQLGTGSVFRITLVPAQPRNALM